eukprot:TRINITY_DN4691_c0_g1_i1.p1 TRINITY_DN4691_c0_g1~~TRINITY_DN4691_c0_g1_i1.p1  ORF type:complete len:500 (+),score=151.78 TRINITY_DN4691_c0_g1_i1:74-1573(+)
MTMLPEPPMPNIQSPRVKAAMKVLGVHPAEIEKQEVEEFGGSETKHLLFEKKRRTLIYQVMNLATKGHQGGGDGGGLGPAAQTADDRNAAFMAKVIEKEKKSMEVMARMAKKDIQKCVIEELEGKLQVYANQKRQEEGHQRMKALEKERNDFLKQRRKEAEKKLEKTQEVRRRADQQKLEHCQALREILQKADERVAEQLQAVKDAHAEKVFNAQDKYVVIAERQADREKTNTTRLEKLHDEIEEKHARKQQMLFEQKASRASHAEEILAKEMQCRDRVAKHLDEKQAKIEAKYWECEDRHTKAKEYRETTHAAMLKEFKTANMKKKNAHEGRYTRMKEEAIAAHDKFCTERLPILQRSASDALGGRLRPPERAEAIQARDDNYNHVDLAATNRERLRRAHSHSVEQQINKLLAKRERVQILQDAKAAADKRRMATLRNCGMEKEHLSLKVERVRDSGPEKMLKLIDGMEIDDDAKKRINDVLANLELPPLGGVTKEDD